MDFVTMWLAQDPIQSPRRIFVHLVDPSSGKVIAQHDGLDSPTRFWRNQDEVLQTHHLAIPQDAPLGEYELRIGLYDPITGIRVPLTTKRDTDGPDYIVLGTIEITR